MIAIGLVGHFLGLRTDLEIIITLITVMLLTLVPIFITERALKDRFPE